ncbi:CAAX amino terminal protease self- immunity [compost metagenome]
MIARRLSQFFALALAALTFWVLVSAPGVVGTEFVGTIYVGFALLAVVFFGLTFVALRFATTGSTIYWSAGPRPNQVGWILAMIGVALAILLSVGWIFERQGRLDEIARIVPLVTWTLVPAAFLALGLVKWPARLKSASKLRLCLVGAAALGFATAVSYAKFANGPAGLEIPSVGDLFIPTAGLILAAAAEEVIFRVLLLTALLDLTQSRFHAVFVSSVVFGLIHPPLALMQPVVHGDWPVLQYAAQAYAPAFLLQTVGGLVLGVVWLRTGSIGLVVVTHAIINVGPTLLTGM